MDLAYANYIRDPKKFLRDFAMKKFEATDKLAGVILSYSQTDLSDDLSLFESLEIIIATLRNPEALSLCYLRFFKSAVYFLRTYPTPNSKLLQIYSRICSSLPQSLGMDNVTSHISQFFCNCFDYLLGIYAKKLDFVKIIHIGRKNIALFQDKPEILNDEIFQNIEKLSRIKDESSVNEILISIINLSKYMNNRTSRSAFLALHLVEILRIIYDEKITLQAFDEFSFRMEKIILMFGEDARKELQVYEKEAANRLGYVKGQRREVSYGSLGIRNETPTGISQQIGYGTLGGPGPFSIPKNLGSPEQAYYSGIPPEKLSPRYNQREFSGSKPGQMTNSYDFSSNSQKIHIENYSYSSGDGKVNQNLPRYQQNPYNYPGPSTGYNNQNQRSKASYPNQNPNPNPNPNPYPNQNQFIQKERSPQRFYSESQKEGFQNEPYNKSYPKAEQPYFIGKSAPDFIPSKQKIIIPKYNPLNNSKPNMSPPNSMDSSDFGNYSKPELTREIFQPEPNKHTLNKSDEYAYQNKNQPFSMNSTQAFNASKMYIPPAFPVEKDEIINVYPNIKNSQPQFVNPNKNVYSRNESPKITEFNKEPISHNQSPDKNRLVVQGKNNAIENENCIEIIRDAIINLENQWSNDPCGTGTETLKNILNDFASELVGSEAKLTKCLKTMINGVKLDSSKIDFWRYIIESIDDNLSSEAKSELMTIIDESIDLTISHPINQCMRASANFRKRPTFRARDNGRREIKDFTDPGNEEEKPEFIPLGEIPVICDYMPKKIPQAQVVNIGKSQEPQSKIKAGNLDKDPNSIIYCYETSKCSIICEEKKDPSMGDSRNALKNYEQICPEQKELKKEESFGQIQKIERENEKPILKVPMAKATEYLTIDGTKIVSKHKGSFEDIIEISEIITDIKDKIQIASPSSRLRTIGSTHIGTYIKNSDIDVLLIDHISSNPSSIFCQAVSSYSDINVQVFERQIFMSPKSKQYKYRIFINEEISFELSSLIKEYCKLDLRCADLIIIMKLWAKKNKICGEKLLTGVHLSLLVILFLQQCTPPVLPCLQAFEHNPNFINQFDTWFLTNYDFESSNIQSLGDLILLFFEFLVRFSEKNCVGDARHGLVYDNSESNYLFSMFHPFTMHELSFVLKQSQERSTILQILKQSFNLLNSGEKLSNIIPS